MKLDLTRFVPSWNAVVVEQDPTEEKKGSIILTDAAIESDTHAKLTGTVHAIGELAFTFGTPGKDDFVRLDQRPRVGDKVVYKKYSGGNFFEGEDDKKYRILDHTDIIGVLK